MAVYVWGEEIGKEQYPNKETIFKALSNRNYPNSRVDIELKYENDMDINKLIITKYYLDEMHPNSRKQLYMFYVPYSRMDREIPGYMFTLKYFAQMINSLNFDIVTVFDPHSAETFKQIKHIRVLDQPHVYLSTLLPDLKVNYILFPDKGASSRYKDYIFPEYITTFCADKERDLNTGKIIRFKLINCPNIQGQDVLIVDDLCAKGGTFMASAQLLKEAGANNIYLYVSHCENNIFDGDILKTDLITQVFTTDSIIRPEHEKIVNLYL